MSVLFSKVELDNDDGEEFELFIGGIPREYEDLEDGYDFNEFMELQYNSSEFTIHVKSYIYGDGETENADDNQLTEIEKHFDDPKWSESLDLIEESSFSFFYNVDELYDMEMNDANKDFEQEM